MPDPRPGRLTPKQVMCGLRIAWPTIIGDRRPIAADMRIDEHLKACGVWDEIDLADVGYALDRFFNTRVPTLRAWKRDSFDQWADFFGAESCCQSAADWETRFAPRVTFGALAQFISRRADAIVIEPAMVLGRPCAAAGAFRTIQRVIETLRPATPRFAPSAPVLSVIRGRSLRVAWETLRWMSEDRLPSLHRMWTDRLRDLVGGGWAFLAAIAAILGVPLLPLMSDLPWGAPTLITVSVTVGLWVAIAFTIQFVESRCDPLPAGLDDFRSVARAMVLPDATATPPGK